MTSQCMLGECHYDYDSYIQSYWYLSTCDLLGTWWNINSNRFSIDSCTKNSEWRDPTLYDNKVTGRETQSITLYNHNIVNKNPNVYFKQKVCFTSLSTSNKNIINLSQLLKPGKWWPLMLYWCHSSETRLCVGVWCLSWVNNLLRYLVVRAPAIACKALI